MNVISYENQAITRFMTAFLQAVIIFIVNTYPGCFSVQWTLQSSPGPGVLQGMLAVLLVMALCLWRQT